MTGVRRLSLNVFYAAYVVPIDHYVSATAVSIRQSPLCGKAVCWRHDLPCMNSVGGGICTSVLGYNTARFKRPQRDSRMLANLFRFAV